MGPALLLLDLRGTDAPPICWMGDSGGGSSSRACDLLVLWLCWFARGDLRLNYFGHSLPRSTTMLYQADKALMSVSFLLRLVGSMSDGEQSPSSANLTDQKQILQRGNFIPLSKTSFLDGV